MIVAEWDAKEGMAKLEQYATWLERDWPSAAASLRVFARALGWDDQVVEFDLNHSPGQRTVGDLSSGERAALTDLNRIDAQVYEHAVGRFLRLCSQYGLELNESERVALTQRGAPAEGNPADGSVRVLRGAET